MNIVIALAAGVASALMFASIISGSAFSLILFYFAPLPLMVAGLGWGTGSALLAGALASAAQLGFLGFHYFVVFAVAVAAPSILLGYLVLLARPVITHEPSAAPALEWYPTGRLLLWIALIASAIMLAALLSLGLDAETISDALQKALSEFAQLNESGIDPDNGLLRIVVGILPPAAVIASVVSLTINLWVSAKITATSGHLKRPWPDLSATALPFSVLIVLACAIALSFTGGLIAIMAEVIGAALLTAYLFVGLALLHVLMQPVGMRGLWLGVVYASIAIFGWPALLFAILGLAEAIFGLRQRILAGRKRPPISS